MTKCNTRIEDAGIHEKDLSIGITFHHLGLIIAAVTGLISIILAQYLIFQHSIHYLKPWEQKHIIRILFMIPVYSAVSFLSYFYFKHAIYFEVLRDCYEAFAIASFFTLLCNYLATNLHDQKEYFRTATPKNWIWPLTWLQKCTGGREKGILKIPRSGLTWFNIIHVGVFQYCFIRVFFTIVSVITQALDLYCESSLSPAFAHIWVQVFEGASVTVAMYTLIQFYIQLRADLAPHKPFLKLLCIKLVIFFSFWQNLVISFLSSSSGPLQPTPHISWPDIVVGIPSVLLTCEMAIFAVMHLFAFGWRKPYGRPNKHTADHEALNAPGSTSSGSKPGYQGGFLGWKAIIDAFNPWDLIKASARSFRWLFVGVRRRHQDISYQQSGSAGSGSGPNGRAPPGAYDSTKLQPIAVGGAHAYPLSDTWGATYAGSNAPAPYYTGYGDRDRDEERDEAADPRLGRWNRSTAGEDPWNANSRFTPSPSPSPVPAAGEGEYHYNHERDGDRAGLLRYAGAEDGGGSQPPQQPPQPGPQPGFGSQYHAYSEDSYSRGDGSGRTGVAR